MSVAVLDRTANLAARDLDVANVAVVEFSPRTRMLLHGPIVPMLLRMAWPNVLVMFAQAATGLIETWFVSKLGTDALAGMALVFPSVMLMQMISAGAMGGGISSAIARALGAGRRDEADLLVMHALVISVTLGASFSVIMLVFGRPIYRALGGEGGELDAAVSYCNVVFAGNVLLWVMNGLANVVRGTGNMLVPALVICVGVVVLVPLSPLLIFGIGPFPALGIAGGGTALVLFYAAGTAALGWYVLSGRNIARLRMSRLRWPLFRNILGVGTVASVTSLQTNVIIALATALVATTAGPGAAAGYGTGARLEYLLIPIIFGLGPARSPGGYEYRPRSTRTSAAHRLRRGGNRVCDHRGDRHRRSHLATALDHAVQRRSARGRNGKNLSALCRTGLWVLRLGPRALLRIAGSGTTILAVIRRVSAHAGCHRRWIARRSPHRLAAVVVRSHRVWPVPACGRAVCGHRLGRMVS